MQRVQLSFLTGVMTAVVLYSCANATTDVGLGPDAGLGGRAATSGGGTTAFGANTSTTGGRSQSSEGGSVGGSGANAASVGGRGVTTGGVTTGGVTTGGAMTGGGRGATTGGAVTGGGGVTSVGGSERGGSSGSGGAGHGGLAAGGKGGAGGRSSGGGNVGGSHSETGGGGVTMGGTAGAGSSPFQPCPKNGDPCKILPLGDSITWGIQYDGAYRVELFTKAIAAQQKITFTGSLSNGPNTVSNASFPKNNEGHSGWTIAQITDLVPSPAFNTLPNIVLLMIGTNDIYASSGQAAMPQRLGTLLDKIIVAAPNALVIVAKITPLSNASWNATIKTYNDAIPGLVSARAAAGKHILLGDMNTGFVPSMLSTDNIHPNKSGYDFMGDQWYALIGDLLPK